MKIQKIIEQSSRPQLHEKGTAIMWTDPHISKYLLETHLNPEIDLASRKPETINKTVDWILSQCKGQSLNILDLGCGPGLYSEIYASRGHSVTGLDFSSNSIEYAQNQASSKNLDIEYIEGNYLDLQLAEEQFDLVTLIFTDFGPLLPNERKELLAGIKKVLKPGGKFILDILTDRNIESKLSPKTWDVADHGFWKDKPYVALSESFLYPEEKVILYQHIVINEQDEIDTYRFWNHFFSDEDLGIILSNNGFENVEFHHNIIPATDFYSGDDVTFCTAVKQS